MQLNAAFNKAIANVFPRVYSAFSASVFKDEAERTMVGRRAEGIDGRPKARAVERTNDAAIARIIFLINKAGEEAGEARRGVFVVRTFQAAFMLFASFHPPLIDA